MLYHFMPALTPQHHGHGTGKTTEGYNDFSFDFTIHQSRELSDFFHLPLQNLHDASLTGKVDSRGGYANFDLEVPYLYNGKVIENTDIFGQFDIPAGNAMLYATTMIQCRAVVGLGPGRVAVPRRGYPRHAAGHYQFRRRHMAD